MERVYVLIGLVAWFALTSLVAVYLTRKDKRAAGKGKWRVKEATLLTVSALGGGAAMLVTMRLIRHKTNRKKFMWGIPLIILLQIAALVTLAVLYWYFLR